MEILEGSRGDYTVYILEDHVYKLVKTLNGRKYFHCLKKTCKGSVVVNTETDESRFLVPHIHPSDKILVEKYKFLTVLRQRARCENVASRTLYTECLLGLSDEAVERIGAFKNYRRIIQKAKSSSASYVGKRKESVLIKKPLFTILDGLRSDTKVHLCKEFLYHFRKSFNHKKYFNCIQKTCKAKLTHDDSKDEAVLTRTHNHPSDKLAVEYHEFLTVLRSRARNEKTNPRILFEECLEGFSKETVDKFGCYEEYKKILYHARTSKGQYIYKEEGGSSSKAVCKDTDFYAENGSSDEFDLDYDLTINEEGEKMEYEEIIIQIVSDDEREETNTEPK